MIQARLARAERRSAPPRLEEVPLDPISASGGAAQALATMQVFALKQATNAQATAAQVLLQAVAPGNQPASPSHLGRRVDASA